MIVLGVDPGLRISGYAVIKEKQQQLLVLDAGALRIDADLPMAERLLQIHHDIDALLAEHEIDIMAVEKLYAHYKHPRTAILMGHARGIFLLAAAAHKIPVDEYAATRIKKSLTGSGRAGKEQMQRSVALQLDLPQPPSPPDVADALAVAMCCINEHNRQEVSL